MYDDIMYGAEYGVYLTMYTMYVQCTTYIEYSDK